MIDLALKHLGLLGYKDGVRIYLRTITPDGRAANLEATYPNLPALPTDTNVYAVINGCGHSDKTVSQCRAIFYEHDDLDKTVQLDLWQSLGLPKPTFQIDTGGKSIHSYWTLKVPIPADQWRSLQSDLLEFSDADRTIKNPSRVMRLAGSVHQSTGQQTTIITQSGQRYPYEALRAVIPEQAKPERKQRTQQAATMGVIPLTAVLATKNRALIETGCTEGGRNDSGAALARDLIGCEKWLQASGIPFDGSAEQFFNDYCDCCNPHLDERERGAIWRSALSDSPTPTLSVDKILGCIQAWERKGDRILAAVEPERVAANTKRESDGAQAVSELSKANELLLAATLS